MTPPTISPIYGRLLTATAVEAAMRDHIAAWLPDYLAEMERQTGRTANTIPVPSNYRTSADFERWNEERLPEMVMVSPGLMGEPVATGERGRYRAVWGLAIVVVVSANTKANTDSLAKLYAAAIRGAVMQHRSLGGFARGTQWLDESYDAIPSDSSRNLMGVTVKFAIEVDDVVSTKAGTSAPVQPASPTPYTPAPTDPVVPDKQHITTTINPATIQTPLP